MTNELKGLQIALANCIEQRNAALNQVLDQSVPLTLARERIAELEKKVAELEPKPPEADPSAPIAEAAG